MSEREVVYTLKGIEVTQDFISLQGSIGAGKSTLLKSIRRWIDENRRSAIELTHLMQEGAADMDFFVVVDEPLKQWSEPKYRAAIVKPDAKPDEKISLLGAFYMKPKKLGFTFQVNAFTSRLANLRATLERIPLLPQGEQRRIHILSERSMLTDRLFFTTVCESNPGLEIEWDVYDRFSDLICAHVNRRENVMIYLPSSVPTCQQRIEERDRLDETESGIGVDYLQRLDANHKLMVEEFDGRVIRLDSFEQSLSGQQIDALVEQLMAQLSYRERVAK